MKSLAPHTGQIFDAISQLDCIRGYLLVGGTALSLQIHNRLSEDLDFMKWRTSKSEKMEVLLRRSTYRDYYDIYSLLQEGVQFKEMVDLALRHSGHVLHTKNLYAMLTNSLRFVPDSHFVHLEPKYDITPAEIESYIRSQI